MVRTTLRTVDTTPTHKHTLPRAQGCRYLISAIAGAIMAIVRGVTMVRSSLYMQRMCNSRGHACRLGRGGNLEPDSRYLVLSMFLPHA